MEDIQEYGIGFSIDKKSYSQIMKFEKRINDMYNKINKAAINSDNKITKSAEQSEKAKIKAQEAAQRKQKQLDAKALKDAKRLEDNRLRVFRSATFEKLSLDQKLNLTRVIKNAKTVEELKDQERKLTSFYKRENKRREKMLRNKARATGRTTQGSFNTGAVGSFGSTGGRLAAAGTMLANAMMNPITAAAVGVAAIIAGSVSALRTGTDKFQELRAGAAVSGSDVATLKKQVFVYQSVAGKEYSVDKVADMSANLQEKVGQVKTDGIIGKDGLLMTGGGEGEDIINALLRAGVIAPNMDAIRNYLDVEDPVKLMEKIAKDLNENVKDEKARRFAFEAINDWGKLNSALIENKHRVQKLEQQYDEMDMGIAPENIDSVKELTATLNTMGAASDNLSLKFTEGFSSMLSKETLKSFEDFTATLNPLFYGIGKVIGGIVEFIAIMNRGYKALLKFMEPFSPMTSLILMVRSGFTDLGTHLTRFKEGIDNTKEVFDSVGNSLTDFCINMKEGWNNIIDWITNKFTGFVDSIKNAMDKISDTINDKFSWFTGGSKKETSNIPSANASNFFMASPTVNVPSVKETQARLNRSVNTGQPTQVVLQVDKEKLGSVVIDTNSFEGGVGNVLYPIFR